MMMMMMMMVVMIMYFTKTSADTVTISNALPRRDTSGEIMVGFLSFVSAFSFSLNVLYAQRFYFICFGFFFAKRSLRSILKKNRTHTIPKCF